MMTEQEKKEKQRGYNKAWKEVNRDHVKEYRKAYKQREDSKERGRLYMEKVRRETGVPIRQPRMSNDEMLRRANVRAKIYYAANKEKVNVYKKSWVNQKIQSDPHFKLKKRLGARIYNALRGTVKSARTVELIGCSVDDLQGHIAAQFSEGMTWENYGKWHVDHRAPCASFDLTKPEDQRRCFNYKNLQPLWAFDNMSKGARIMTPEGLKK